MELVCIVHHLIVMFSYYRCRFERWTARIRGRGVPFVLPFFQFRCICDSYELSMTVRLVRRVTRNAGKLPGRAKCDSEFLVRLLFLPYSNLESTTSSSHLPLHPPPLQIRPERICLPLALIPALDESLLAPSSSTTNRPSTTRPTSLLTEFLPQFSWRRRRTESSRLDRRRGTGKRE